MAKPKNLEQLRAEKEQVETHLAQEQHKLERLENRKSYPFHYEGNGNQLFVFEAPIDLLSFICLYPQDWQTRSLSMCTAPMQGVH